MTKSVQKAVAAHTDRLIQAGGSRINLKLSPAANAVLMAYCAENGMSRTQVIIEAILKLRVKE